MSLAMTNSRAGSDTTIVQIWAASLSIRLQAVAVQIGRIRRAFDSGGLLPGTISL